MSIESAGPATPLWALLRTTLGEDLDAYVVRARNDGLGWAVIAGRLGDSTGIIVSPETLRSWYADRLETVVRLKADARPVTSHAHLEPLRAAVRNALEQLEREPQSP